MATEPGVEGHSFLVVDDVRFARMTLARMLREMGAGAVREAGDGAAAVEALSDPDQQTDCLITDLQMPVMSGLELLKAIRTGDAGVARSLPVVMLTTQSELASIATALLLSLDEFIAKPVSQQTLRACLGRVFSPETQATRSLTIADAELYRAVDPVPLPVTETAGRASVRGERQVPLDEVPEGAVLTREMLHENGRLLLPPGVRLSGRVLSRIRQIAGHAGGHAKIWITV